MTANEIMKSIKDNLDNVEHNLEQIQCDDCISREAAIYVASGFCHPSNVAKELEKLPSVTPKPKTGHWIDCSNGWMCSNCEKDNTYDTDYCPNCGSYNGGDDNGNE